MSDLPKEQDENEDLFDFPKVEGFSPEFIEAARLQTEAANATSPEINPSFDNQGGPQGTDADTDLDDEDFEDDFADLMGDPIEEAPEEEELVGTATATSTGTSPGPNFRFVWGALTLLFVANLLWAWTWYASEDRFRGEMDQRFQGYLAKQREQLDEVVSAMTPSEGAEGRDQDHGQFPGDMGPIDEAASLLEEIERDLMYSRYETARAKAWSLIARVDALPEEHRGSTEASARLLIAESYEIQGTDSQENKG